MADDQAIRDRLAALDTPALSDALDRLGVEGQVVGIRVEPGDWLRGDGVVVIPQPVLAEVLEAAEQIAAVEDRIRNEVDSGRRLDEIRRRLACHDPQARQD